MMRYKLHQVTGFYDFYVCRSIRAKRIRTASCRYAKICQVTRRLPKILDEFQKNVLGNTSMLPIAHLKSLVQSACQSLALCTRGSLFWIYRQHHQRCQAVTVKWSICIHLCQIICYLGVISPYISSIVPKLQLGVRKRFRLSCKLKSALRPWLTGSGMRRVCYVPVKHCSMELCVWSQYIYIYIHMNMYR